MQPETVQQFYENEMEKDRLDTDLFMLEGIRTKEIISRYLKDGRKKILDIGGGAGFYSFWLKQQGHEVHLRDLTPRNIELTNSYSNVHGIKLDSTAVANAVALDEEDHSFDIALLMGPLYHLTEKESRLKALQEARRILKPGGILVAAVISRYASVFDGFSRDLVMDKSFVSIMEKDLATGIHINNTSNPEYFTTAFFHTPSMITEEIKAADLVLEKLVAVESFGWTIPGLPGKIKDAVYLETLLNTINRVEENADLLAMSPHIVAIAHK